MRWMPGLRAVAITALASACGGPKPEDPKMVCQSPGTAMCTTISAAPALFVNISPQCVSALLDCPSASRIARCTVVHHDPAGNITEVTRFYPPLTVAYAQDFCATTLGTYGPN